jgi:hypothetical protein
MGGPRPAGSARLARPSALLSAVATLLGALFLCLGPPAEEHRPARGADPVPAYSCPHEGGSCGLRAPAVAAVLSAPPLDLPPPGGGPLVRPGTRPGAGPGPADDARPRAPGLHVLQVLRI